MGRAGISTVVVLGTNHRCMLCVFILHPRHTSVALLSQVLTVASTATYDQANKATPDIEHWPSNIREHQQHNNIASADSSSPTTTTTPTSPSQRQASHPSTLSIMTEYSTSDIMDALRALAADVQRQAPRIDQLTLDTWISSGVKYKGCSNRKRSLTVNKSFATQGRVSSSSPILYPLLLLLFLMWLDD
jgi:hypothetical protein